jgi:hypothetical protein
LFNHFLLEFRKVVKTPTRKPINKAGKGLGKTFELDPYAIAP